MIDPEYVVCDEHTLGYRVGSVIAILQASILRGALFELHPGPKLASLYNVIRPATPKDFAEFRVKLPPDFKESK